MSLKVLERDQWCRVTSSRVSLNNAHVIPKEENNWFDQNSMSIYNANRRLRPTHLVSDVRNGLALRSDLKKSAFDASKFVIVPKQGRMMVHFLDQTHELGILYHNRELHPILQVSREFLYARFTWSIFPLLSSFLSSGPKYLRLASKTPVGFEYKDVLVDWVETLRQREEDPRKRRRGGAADSGNVDHELGLSNDLGECQDSSACSDDSSTRDSIVSKPVIDSLERLRCCWSSDAKQAEQDRLLQELAFPQMSEEKEHGAGYVWDEITWYPRSDRVEAMKDVLRRDRTWVEVLAGAKRRRIYGEQQSPVSDHESKN